jgi:DnaD/phage-associated family protein
MKQFEGFPERMQFTSVPNLFFSRVMPEIDDISELKLTLHIFRLIYGKKGYPRFVSYRELHADSGIRESLMEDGREFSGLLSRTLEQAEERGTIIGLDFEREGESERLYFLNTENNRNAIDKIRDGSIEIKGLRVSRKPVSGVAEKLPDIFKLYEENVGMLSPMVADWLKDAEKTYPESWIRDAIKEAVSLNKRNWRYIDKILENWSAEGRGDGTHRRDNQTNPAKYRNQKYDHLIKR